VPVRGPGSNCWGSGMGRVGTVLPFGAAVAVDVGFVQQQ
jgi:hypothetical protein